MSSIYILYLGGDWGQVDADAAANGDAIDDVGAFNGFPLNCPEYPQHPPLIWYGAGNGTPKSRRQDFERSIVHVPLGRNRDPNRARGRDIDPFTYARRQDMENKTSCRSMV